MFENNRSHVNMHWLGSVIFLLVEHKQKLQFFTCLFTVCNKYHTVYCSSMQFDFYSGERIEQETSKASSKERKKEIECLSLLSQGLNASKVSFERSQNMLYSLKANKNHV